MSTVPERIAAARAKLAEQAKRRETEDAAALEVETLATLEREVALGAEIERIEAGGAFKLGRTLLVVHARLADGAIVGSFLLRAASPIFWSRYRNTVGDLKGIEIEKAQDLLWRACVVWPEKGEIDPIVELCPGVKTTLGDAACRLYGFRAEDLAGK